MKTDLDTVYPKLGSLGLGQCFEFFYFLNRHKFLNTYRVVGIPHEWLKDPEKVYFVHADNPRVLFCADPKERVKVIKTS